MRGKMRAPLGRLGRCRAPTTSWPGMPLICWPSNAIVPRRGPSSPEMVRIVVDLPAPFEPIRLTISPG